MIKVSHIIENQYFRTVKIHLEEKSYFIKVSEKEIDDELEKNGINPMKNRLYATPVTKSRNMMAADIAEKKLLEIMEDELLEKESEHEYTYKLASDWDSHQSHSRKIFNRLDIFAKDQIFSGLGLGR
mgnify:CR=1 FL=1